EAHPGHGPLIRRWKVYWASLPLLIMWKPSPMFHRSFATEESGMQELGLRRARERRFSLSLAVSRTPVWLKSLWESPYGRWFMTSAEGFPKGVTLKRCRLVDLRAVACRLSA